jgi:hypothetical protein
VPELVQPEASVRRIASSIASRARSSSAMRFLTTSRTNVIRLFALVSVTRSRCARAPARETEMVARVASPLDVIEAQSP